MTQQTKRNQKLLLKLIECLLEELKKDEDFFYAERPWILTHGQIQEAKLSSNHRGVKKNIHWLLNKIDDLVPPKNPA